MSLIFSGRLQGRSRKVDSQTFKRRFAERNEKRKRIQESFHSRVHKLLVFRVFSVCRGSGRRFKVQSSSFL
jgi:hypothetical protein